jgi:tetratricopeptide (TPR) repeat protein
MRAVVIALGLLLSPAALAAGPSPEARADKEAGDRKRQAGDLVGAAAAYQAAIGRAGDYAEAHEALGEVRWAQHRPEEAVVSFQAAVDAYAGYAYAWYNLAFSARKSGDPARARAAYERYVKMRPADPDGHFGFGETLRALGEREAAVREYQLFVDLARADPAQGAWVEKARAAIADLRAGTPVPTPAAVAAPSAAPAPIPAAAAMPAPPSTAPALIPTSVQGSSSTAAAAPAAAAPVAAASPAAVQKAAVPSQASIEKLGSADRAFLAGNLKGALFLYQDAVYMDPTSVAARVRLARCYAALRYPAQAELQLRQALELDPSSAEARQVLEELRHPPLQAAAGGGSGMPGSGAAPPSPAQAAGAEPSAAAIQESAGLYRAGVAQIGQREFAAAVESLSRALDKNPRLGVAYEARGSARFGLGLYRDAAEDYLTAIRMQPERASPLWGLAECQRLLGDPRAAESYERYAASSAPDASESLRDQARRRTRDLRGP